MALDKKKLIEDIVELQKEMLGKEQADFQAYAEKLADALEAYITSATVTVAKGIAVNAGGYTGTTTAEGTGTIS